MKKPAMIAALAFLTCMPAMVQAQQNGGKAQGSDKRKVLESPPAFRGKLALMAKL
jgi:hypothetical protein